jgi:fatty acid desaturase
VRQVIGSANFTTGGLLNDCLHGFLHYQIEHHCFTSMSPYRLTLAQPMVARACAKIGIPYVQEPLWRRARMLFRCYVLATPMRAWCAHELEATLSSQVTRRS